MSIIWLLERDVFLANRTRLEEAIVAWGGTVAEGNVLPSRGVMLDRGGRLVELSASALPSDAQGLFGYGSLEMATEIVKHQHSVTVYCNLPQLRCSYYYPRFGSFLLQQEAVFLPFGELPRRRDWLREHLGSEGNVFIRPDDGAKSFAGQVVRFESWERNIERLGFYDVTPETLCVVAVPQTVHDEWRFVIGSRREGAAETSGQHIVTGCRSRVDGQPVDSAEDELTTDVLDFVTAVLEGLEYRPDPLWILDIARTDSGLAVAEVGSLSCSDLYGCDLHAVVEAVHRSLSET